MSGPILLIQERSGYAQLARLPSMKSILII